MYFITNSNGFNLSCGKFSFTRRIHLLYEQCPNKSELYEIKRLIRKFRATNSGGVRILSLWFHRMHSKYGSSISFG